MNKNPNQYIRRHLVQLRTNPLPSLSQTITTSLALSRSVQPFPSESSIQRANSLEGSPLLPAIPLCVDLVQHTSCPPKQVQQQTPIPNTLVAKPPPLGSLQLFSTACSHRNKCAANKLLTSTPFRSTSTSAQVDGGVLLLVPPFLFLPLPRAPRPPNIASAPCTQPKKASRTSFPTYQATDRNAAARALLCAVQVSRWTTLAASTDVLDGYSARKYLLFPFLGCAKKGSTKKQVI